MKKLLYILLFVPLALFGQEDDIITQLNQSFDAWNVSIDLSEGWNMFGYGCPNPIDVVDGLSNHTESIAIVKDNNGAVYMPEWDFNGIGDFTPGFGYQIKLTEAIEGFSLCDWYVNDIPEDNIVSLQVEVEELTLEIKCLTNPEIGDNCFGGIVFYVDETGEHGLIAAPEDVGGYEYGCYFTEIPGAEGVSIGTGFNNTLDIINNMCTPNGGDGITAAQATIDYISGAYDDWFLPSLDELEAMYLNIGETSALGNVGGFSDWWYWTSTERNFIQAESRSLSSFEEWHLIEWKYQPNTVRPIRAFGNWTLGCMDSLACNFNPNANMADGSCEYPEQGYDCDGNCVDELACNYGLNEQCQYPELGYDCDGNFVEYVLGMETEGGIVFYVDDTGEHGLVAALEDLEETYEWGCYGDFVSEAQYTPIGYGNQNTIEILNQNCQTLNSGSTAAQVTSDYENQGYSDWFLPSKFELVEMYNSIGNGGFNGNVANFTDQVYWSSSDDVGSQYSAWVVNFEDGFHYWGSGKDANLRVRPIRAFGNWTMGCMNETACNFNPEANMADGSCEYAQEGYDCEGNVSQFEGFIYIGAYEGNNYYLSQGMSVWEDANLLCNNNGGHLVTISNEGENTFVTNTLIDDQSENLTYENWELRCFIGLKKTDETWSWVNDETTTYSSWAPSTNEPSGDGNCTITNHDIYHPNYGENYFGYWNDQACDSGEAKFIMEIEID